MVFANLFLGLTRGIDFKGCTIIDYFIRRSKAGKNKPLDSGQSEYRDRQFCASILCLRCVMNLSKLNV